MEQKIHVKIVGKLNALTLLTFKETFVSLSRFERLIL